MDSAVAVIAEWMPRQRWFGGKGHAPLLRLIGGFELPTGAEDTRVRTLLVMDDASEPPILYQVPVVDRKISRQLHHRDNPDVTLQTALAASGSRHVPASVGDVVGEWDDIGRPIGRATGHLAFAQEFLPGVEDAWRVALLAAADAATTDAAGRAAFDRTEPSAPSMA